MSPFSAALCGVDIKNPPKSFYHFSVYVIYYVSFNVGVSVKVTVPLTTAP